VVGKRVNIPVPDSGLDLSQNPGVIDIACISTCDGWIGYKDLIRKDWELIRVRQSTGPAGLRAIDELSGCDADAPEYHPTYYDGIKDDLFPSWPDMTDWEEDDEDSDPFWCVSVPYEGKFGGGGGGCNPHAVAITGQTEPGGKVKYLKEDVDYKNLNFSYTPGTGTLTVGFTIINSSVNHLAVEVENLCPQDENKKWVEVPYKPPKYIPDKKKPEDNYYVNDGPGMNYESGSGYGMDYGN